MRQIRGLSRSKVLVVSLIVQCASIHGEEISKESGSRPVSYWNDIRPLMQASCQGCHQPAKAKGEFAANVTHELRTPMNAVLGMLDLVLTMGLTTKQQEYVETALLYIYREREREI